MSIKDILVHLTPEAASRPAGSVHYAIGMADKLGAHLTALVFANDFTKPATFYGGATDEDIAEARERFRRAAEQATAKFSRNAARAGIRYETVTEESLAEGAPQIMNEYAKLRDLMICGNDQTGLFDGKTFGEYVLFASGRPVIVVPPGQGGPFACERILVAWDYGRPAARAAADALPLLKIAKQVFVVTVSDDKAIKSARSGTELARHFARHGVEVIVENIPQAERSIDETLLAYASARHADLIVMGGYGHSRLREFVLGGATRGMLENTDRSVLFSH
ncbi:universal stress protein [Roseiarcaceae bacterium H3SJ34-1]|uniref:universal stress protein n=1 Tax=Terripilifer ovatus TaxID=3032367 RepID=UPI003AB98548|nr:universal stress protein [Roseiarcaceae bacterium H3SJ34-1]